ncbi:hypothetical protein Cadr_000024756 [Camelus dromedarius]|uniref:Uncharacterized protein n=1 Tax=Camelus dromedarius TaxID=9838 RepID=A0A5N4CPH4_CAMDR|nr:hypothetical protein Cadr_000024756 [Camelus dromedarius]
MGNKLAPCRPWCLRSWAAILSPLRSRLSRGPRGPLRSLWLMALCDAKSARARPPPKPGPRNSQACSRGEVVTAGKERKRKSSPLYPPPAGSDAWTFCRHVGKVLLSRSVGGGVRRRLPFTEGL